MTPQALRPTILLVEDEPAILRLVQGYLESSGFAVHGETHGEPAIAYAADHKPDLVILDLRLPDVHGLEVCDELRRRYRPWTLPIMILTAMDSSFDKARGYAHGADAYLTKPFDPPMLLPAIAQLLNKMDLEDQPDHSELPPF